jgi:hypothetical protein
LFQQTAYRAAGQHVIGDVKFELFQGSEVLAAERTTRHDDLVLLVHES